MDKNKKKIMDLRIQKIIENLRKNNMEGYYLQTKDEVVPFISHLINEGDTVSVGSSQTLFQCGVVDYLRNGDFNLIDRLIPGLSPEQLRKASIDTFSADVFLCSSNAITENGELYNVDGRSNRVAAILFGPKSVIMVVGTNKIVTNINEAIVRVKKVAAPANCLRRGYKTYCSEKGECVIFQETEKSIFSGCQTQGRPCCNYVISTVQRDKGRIKVIIVCEELGY
jgi:L-lactate utilization protein LutB